LTRIPVVFWRDTVKALEGSGFVFDRQRGSHMVYYHPDTQALLDKKRNADV
jgi:predicted RNA binding protein YcfA (HicA-like mRNA interferase family)